MLRLTAVWAAAAAAAACPDDRPPFARGADTIRFESPSAPPGTAAAIPRQACADSVVAGATIRETAAIVPEERARRNRPQDVGWIPARLADLAASARHLVTVDAGNRALTVFAPDFASRVQRERQGSGPGEMQLPVAVALAPEPEPIWVLDDRRATVLAFTAGAQPIREFRVAPSSVDIAVDSAGTVYVAHRVLTGPARTGGDSTVVVSRYDKDGTARSPLVAFRAGELGPPRFVLPAVTEAGVVAGGDRIAVFYPAGGVVDVYRGGGLQATARVCLPRELEQAYARQRAAPGGQQSWIALITDVRFEPSGEFATVSSRPDRQGRFLIHRFRADGTPRGSIAIDNPGIAMPSEVRFGTSTNHLVAFSPESGIVASFSVRPR